MKTNNDGQNAAESLPAAQEQPKSYGFIGKPLDSECFYGYHNQCRGCNCKCHPDAAKYELVAPVEKKCAGTRDGKCMATKDDTIDCSAPDCLAEPKPTPSEQDDKGSWPLGCVQRAFVEGMKWWQFQHNGSTAFASEVDEAEAEAVNRYGKPQPDSSSISTEQTFEEVWKSEEAKSWVYGHLMETYPIAFRYVAQTFWNAAKGQSNGR